MDGNLADFSIELTNRDDNINLPERSEGHVTPLGLAKGIAGMPEDIIALLERATTSE